MRLLVLVVLLVASNFLASTPARARNPDGTLGLLRRPASTHPVIVLAGDSFEIRCDAPADASGWWAELVVRDTHIAPYPLDLASSTFDMMTGRWIISAEVPSDVPQEVFDLHVGFDGGEDTSLTAVRVYREWPRSYRVAHISDTQNLFAVPGITDRMDDLYRDLAVVAPDFVINTGDLVTYGEPGEYRDFLAVAETARVPTFNIPGNHDIFWTRCWDRELYQRRYERYIGERDYAFDFGADHYVGIEISGYENLCPHAKLSEDQAAFLEADLAAHASAPLTVLFGHQVEHGADVLEDIAMRHGLDFYLYGHIHEDAVSTRGESVFAAVGWAGDALFRVLYVEDGTVRDYTYQDDPIASVPGGDAFSIEIVPESRREVRATLATTVDDDFPGVPLRLEVPPAPADSHWATEGGELWQTVPADGVIYLYLRDITIPAAGEVTVRAFVVDGPAPADAGVRDDAGSIGGDPSADGGVLPVDGGSLLPADSEGGGCGCTAAGAARLRPLDACAFAIALLSWAARRRWANRADRA